jgi:hypothetical protein
MTGSVAARMVRQQAARTSSSSRTLQAVTEKKKSSYGMKLGLLVLVFFCVFLLSPHSVEAESKSPCFI